MQWIVIGENESAGALDDKRYSTAETVFSSPGEVGCHSKSWEASFKR